MYKPQYLNVERTTENIYAGNVCYRRKVETTNLGWKRKPPEKLENKSGRRFSKGK